MIWIIVIAFMVIGGIVSGKLKSKFKQYSKISITSGMNGKEIAERMLLDHNISNVKIVSVPGKLTDHYNPLDRTINLSPDVYQGRHIAAAAVAAHECGHAIQHASAYNWLQIRSQMVPIVSLSGKMMNIIFILGIFGASILHIFSFYQLIMAIIFFQAMITIFSLITLPVEFDASKRALIWLRSSGISNEKEIFLAKDALKWAASTYVVAAIAAATYLLYYISLLRD
jgi:hypothetical protein|tara:strand:- start:4417 stop:5097 length:681 start_codon:yes stop_codon:yes gene_type:complete